MSIQTTLH